ncbi:winged helix-turn-helix domain-containing protein [Streptomyces zagrosensis]|uniref:DNA-binding GntR family transcriptional regulator n=1 Tax=Streptomyces zagrosensis TaxID=1042984 RepID=A0A7W9Q8E2_9ACTN|nr:winged helix-turn-helix domain-containing protein [Streptomyces zagrosensis]MBB5934602.1 DNA-binding GntR family transcriptional regulator [Streptomyces zagrosensis]
MPTSVIDYESPDPPYRQIAADLIADIENGNLAVNRRVPSESALMQMYGVARNTARHAVSYLRDEGYVYTLPQRGTFVRERCEPTESGNAD